MKHSHWVLAATGLICLSVFHLPSESLPTFFVRQEGIYKPLLIQSADFSNSPLSVWHGSGQSGPVRFTIDLIQRKAYVFRNTENVGWTYLSIGREGFATPTRHVRISEEVMNMMSNNYDGMTVGANGDMVHGKVAEGVHRVSAGGPFIGAKMPFWMRLAGHGPGMQAGAISHPGSPASYGCIRAPYDMGVEDLFHRPGGNAGDDSTVRFTS
jgi:hypothetical protein